MGMKDNTMKVDREFTIKRKKHPSAPRYNGRSNQELGSSLTKLMSMLDHAEVEQLCERSLVLDEEGTAVEFDAVLPTDVIGIALDFEDQGYVSTIMEVLNIENDMIVGKDSYTEEEFSFSFEEASVARAMGYFEILYRKDADGKDIPFGVDNDIKVKVMVPEETPTVDPGLGPTPDPSLVAPPGLPENIGDIAAASTDPEVLKALIENAGAASVAVSNSETEKCAGDCSSCETCSTPKPVLSKAQSSKKAKKRKTVVSK